MAKKKKGQNLNNAAVDSSESESSKDSLQTTEANKTICPHISKSVEISSMRKIFKNNKDKDILVCSLCKKIETASSKNGWVCLRCGSYNCGSEEENHRVDHFTTPRSDSHFLALQINTNIIWCFKCEREIPIDVNKKVQSCADIIKKHVNDHATFNTVSIETGSKKMNGIDSQNFLKQDLSPCRMSQSVVLTKEIKQSIPNLPKARGLVNLGNTCFFNSVLQCLAQTPGLVELLREMDIPGEKFKLELDGVTIDAVLEKHMPSTLSDQLAQLLTEVSGVVPAGDGNFCHYAVNPKRLLEALISKCPQFEGGAQHDAHELLRHLLDSVHMEDLRRYQKAILSHIGYKRMDKLEEDKKQFGKKLNQKVRETVPIRPDQIFKGSLVSILTCSVCNHVSKREETFLDLSLPVAQEKAQPPNVRKKQNCSSPVEEKQTTEPTVSKHQQKKEKKNARRNRKNRNFNGNKKDEAQGETTIEEEDKKDSLDGEQSDADVEDNEDNVCEEQDQKTEIVESGYSSEKQMSARGSPVTTQSVDEEPKCDYKPGAPMSDAAVYSAVNSLPDDTEMLSARRAESGIGSIQELTVTIPDEVNTECTSQDSVRVIASKGSPDISSDSQQGNIKIVDIPSSDYKLASCVDNQVDRNAMVYEWNCTGDAKCQSQDSSSVSLSVSPQCGSSQDNVSSKSSPKGSPISGSRSNDNMSICTSLQNSNDNMSVCNSLPENVSMILNSTMKSEGFQGEESGSEERPKSRMECRKNRSSPVELGETTELDSGLLKLSLEGMTCAADMDSDRPEERASPITTESNSKPDPLYNAEGQNGFVLVGDVKVVESHVPPSPPPLPLFTSPYSFSPTETRIPKVTKYRIEEGECSLQSCLNQFTTIELLAGGNKVGCDACTERINKGNKEGKTAYQNSNKQLLICKLPPVVIFHLKRFQLQRCSFRKITRHVDFPLVLDIAPFCSLNKEPLLYSLYGVVEHSGTLHGGHYVAYVKVRSRGDQRPGSPPPGKWFYISDSRVSDVDESAVLRTQAYLLFYERIL